MRIGLTYPKLRMGRYTPIYCDNAADADQGAAMYPSIVGHEIVGNVVRVGDRVKNLKTGDIVGVGSNVWSCGECFACQKDLEQYCVITPRCLPFVD